MNVYQKDHPHNAVFVAQMQSVIDGAPRIVQVSTSGKANWCNVPKDDNGTPLTAWSNALDYRLKPLAVTRTLTYPEPLRVAPAVGTDVWMAHPFYESGVLITAWLGSPGQELALRRGFIFATEADAAEAARAIFGGEL